MSTAMTGSLTTMILWPRLGHGSMLNRSARLNTLSSASLHGIQRHLSPCLSVVWLTRKIVIEAGRMVVIGWDGLLQFKSAVFILPCSVN